MIQEISMKSILVIREENGETICKTMYQILLECIEKLGWTKVYIEKREDK